MYSNNTSNKKRTTRTERETPVQNLPSSTHKATESVIKCLESKLTNYENRFSDLHFDYRQKLQENLILETKVKALEEEREKLLRNTALLEKAVEKQPKIEDVPKNNLPIKSSTLNSMKRRTLVEQLTKQVKYLIREYHQLAISAGVTPGLDEKSLTKIASSTSVLKSINDTSLTPGGLITVAEILNSRHEESISCNSGSIQDVNNNTYHEDSQVSTLRETCELLQEQILITNKDNARNKRFLSDLLYTLSTRGYDSVTEHDGKEIDLKSYKGEQLLVLKGRDKGQKATQKKFGPQDLFMKAIIGSQERAIQTLLQQIDIHQRDVIVDVCRQKFLSSELPDKSVSEDKRSAALEGEILTLVSFMEGVCQRNPDVFNVLKEQYFADAQARETSGMSTSSPVLEIILQRCQRILYPKPQPPPSPKLRYRKEDNNFTRSEFPPNALYPSPPRGITTSPRRDAPYNNSYTRNMNDVPVNMTFDPIDPNCMDGLTSISHLP